VPKSSQRRNDARRQNRDRRARLEELRRQQKAAERRKNFIFVGAAIAVAVVLIAAALIPAYLHDQAVARKNKAGYQAKPTAAERAAGCLGVHNDPIANGGQHVTTPIDYSKEKYGDTRGGTPPIPPSNGRHNPVSLGDTKRFYPLADKPRPERAVHNLEHGYIVAWYDSKLPQAQVDALSLLAQQPAFSRLLVVGWWQGDLPAGKHMVLTSWGRTDRCGSVSEAVVSAFYKAHVNSSLAPESGAGPISGADSIPAGSLPTVSPPASSSASPSASGSASGSPSPKPSSSSS
jgi:hypothetical protein